MNKVQDFNTEQYFYNSLNSLSLSELVGDLKAKEMFGDTLDTLFGEDFHLTEPTSETEIEESIFYIPNAQLVNNLKLLTNFTRKSETEKINILLLTVPTIFNYNFTFQHEKEFVIACILLLVVEVRNNFRNEAHRRLKNKKMSVADISGEELN
jgi:hypothetical protein